MQQKRNFHATKQELSCKRKRTSGFLNATKAEHASNRSGTFMPAMQQKRNFFCSKCNKSGTLRDTCNRTGTFYADGALEIIEDESHITMNVPLLLQKTGRNYKET